MAAVLIDAPAETLILGSGQRIPISGPLKIEGGRVLFRNPAGVLHSIALEDVDLHATATAHPGRMIELRPAPEVGKKLTPLQARSLVVTPERREELLTALSRNREGKPAPLRDPAEFLEDELERSRDRREEMGAAEAEWRAEAAALRESLRVRQEMLQVLLARAQRLEDEIRFFYGTALQDQLGMHVLQLERTRAEIDAARVAVRSAERAFADLQERARRAGALPGWLR